MLVSYEVSVGIRENIFIMMNIVDRSNTTAQIYRYMQHFYNEIKRVSSSIYNKYTLNNTSCEWIFIYTFRNSISHLIICALYICNEMRVIIEFYPS